MEEQHVPRNDLRSSGEYNENFQSSSVKKSQEISQTDPLIHVDIYDNIRDIKVAQIKEGKKSFQCKTCE